MGEDHAGPLRRQDPRSQKIRFHTQTGGVTLQPSSQSQHHPGRPAGVRGGRRRNAVAAHERFDEALALPRRLRADRPAHAAGAGDESGAADSVDPFGGSYFVESLTDEVEARSWELMGRVEQLGGSVEALEFIQREVEESALSYHERYRTDQDVIVGVNKFVTDATDDVEVLKVDPESERRQLERLKAFKEARDTAVVEQRLESLREVARGDGNLLVPIREALRDRASIGEVCGAMRDVFGEYRGGAFF